MQYATWSEMLIAALIVIILTVLVSPIARHDLTKLVVSRSRRSIR